MSDAADTAVNQAPDDTPDTVDTSEPSDASDTSGTEDTADSGASDRDLADASGEPSKAAQRLEREGDIAADYVEELLDIADLDGDIDMDVEGERAMVSVVGGDVEHLVGEGGAVLDALQELTRLAVLRETGERSRLMLDIAGWRAAKRAALTETGTSAADAVKQSGEPIKLAPMTPFERKIVHDAVAAAGLTSESEGQEPNRYVVVLPA
jgi:spoIIIJ-associated protein